MAQEAANQRWELSHSLPSAASRIHSFFKVVQEAGLYSFLTADGRPQTAALEANRRRPSAVKFAWTV
jgi:hypothetical protein